MAPKRRKDRYVKRKQIFISSSQEMDTSSQDMDTTSPVEDAEKFLPMVVWEAEMFDLYELITKYIRDENKGLMIEVKVGEKTKQFQSLEREMDGVRKFYDILIWVDAVKFVRIRLRRADMYLVGYGNSKGWYRLKGEDIGIAISQELDFRGFYFGLQTPRDGTLMGKMQFMSALEALGSYDRPKDNVLKHHLVTIIVMIPEGVGYNFNSQYIAVMNKLALTRLFQHWGNVSKVVFSVYYKQNAKQRGSQRQIPHNEQDKSSNKSPLFGSYIREEDISKALGIIKYIPDYELNE